MVKTQDFTMPDLGEGLEDGVIVEWMVNVGDQVELNQIVVVVESAKATVELPIPFTGVVVERFGEVDETREVGTVLVRIADSADGVDAGSSSVSQLEPTDDEDEPEPTPLVGFGRQQGSSSARSLLTDGASAAAAATDYRVRSTPPVRHLAKRLGVDLTQIPGSGPGGRVTRNDVIAAHDDPPSSSAPSTYLGGTRTETSSDLVDTRTVDIGFRGRRPGEIERVAGIRKRIVEKMETSRRTIPEAGCARETDFTAMLEVSKSLTARARAEGHDIKISPFVLICRATLLMLRRFPPLNSVYDGEAGEIRLLEDINLGVAVDTPGGLLVANVKRAQQLSTLQLAFAIDEVVARCRAGNATPADLTGGTFTVNNFGYFGNDDGNPIINTPEAAILGIGAIRPRPWVVGDQIMARRIARVSLAFDHRVCDGGDAGRAVTYLSELCEDPTSVLLHA